MTNCWHGCGGIAVDPMKLRPDGKLEIDGAARPAALGRILAPLETAAKDDKFLASLLETRRVNFQDEFSKTGYCRK